MNRRAGLLSTLRKWLAVLLLVAQTGLLGLTDFLAIPVAHAAMPATIGYQGRLKDSSGSVQTGTFTFVFRLYSVSSGGSPIYTETQPGISVDQGFFTARIGSVTPFPPTFDFSQILYLSVEVNSDGEMSPRVPVNTVPYAFTTGGINPLAAVPSFTTGGRTYYDTTTGSINYYDATASTWRTLTSSASSTLQGVMANGATTTIALIAQGGIQASSLDVSGAVSLPADSITDAMVVDGLTIDASGSINADAVNAGTLGNASVTLDLSSFGLINGILGDANVSNVLTLSGGVIENSPIGAAIPSTGNFTDTTSTNATVTNLLVTNLQGTNATLTNLYVSNPFALSGLSWSNAQGLNTTATNLYAQNLQAASATTTGPLNVGTSLTVNGTSSLQGLTWLNATGSSLSISGLASTQLLSFTSAMGVNVTTTNLVATTASATTMTALTLNANAANLTTVSSTYISLNASTTNPAYVEGRFFYDATEKSLAYYNDESAVTMNVGQENWIRVKNQTGSSIVDGQLVYVTGSDPAGVPTVALASAASTSTANVVGMATHVILNNGYGYITSFGKVHDLNTSSLTPGITLYLSAVTPGSFTQSRPVSPNVTVNVGVPSKIDAVDGSVLVLVGAPRGGVVSNGAIPFGDANSFTAQDANNFFWDNTGKRLGIGTNTPATSLEVVGTVSATAMVVGGTSVCLANGTNCPSSTAADLQTVTNSGNTTTNAIVFGGGTSTNSFAISGNLSVSGSSSLQNATLANTTSTNSTSTNLFATNGSFTNLSVTNPLTVSGISWTNATGTNSTSTNLFASNATLTSVTSTNLFATNGVFTQLTISSAANFSDFTAINTTSSNSTSTNLFAANGTINSLTFGNGTSTSSFGYTTASGTNLTAQVASLANLTANLVTISGGSLNGVTIGALNPSTGVFTNVTSTNSTSTNLFATNASFANLSVTNPLAFGGLNWTNATGTNTTSTNLAVTGAVNLPSNSITDAMVVDGLMIDSTGLVDAGAIKAGTLGNASVSLDLSAFGSITGVLADANVSNILTLSGSTIDNSAIGNTIASTGIFTSVTSTAASTTNLYATNATVGSLTINNPLTVAGLNWTNATGTNTTSTNLFASKLVLTNGTSTGAFAVGTNLSVAGVSSLQGLTWVDATGTNLALTGMTDIQNLSFTQATGTNLTTTGVVSSTFIHAAESTIGVATASVMNVDSVLHVGIGNFDVIGNAVAQFGGSTDTYLQVNNQNRSNGTSASTDYIATADNGDDSSYYIDLGINGSQYSNPDYTIVGPNDGYLYADSANLAIGTATSGSVIKFHAGGTLDTDEVMRVTANHQVGIGTTNPSSTLDVVGDGRFSGTLVANGLTWLNSTATNATTTNLFASNLNATFASADRLSFANGTSTSWLGFSVASGTSLFASAIQVNGSPVCLLNGTNCPTGTAPDFQTITNTGNTTTNAIVFGGGTSTNSFAVSGNLNVTGASTLQTALIGNATTTNSTSTNLFATNGSFTNLSVTNPLTVAGLSWTNATGTNTTSTNLFASNLVAATGSADSFTLVNGTSTSWFGFATASGTSLFASAIQVNGSPVCLLNGTNCSTSSLQAITTAGNTTTNSIIVYGGITTSNLTATGTTSLQGVSLTSATATAVTTTHLYATNATLANSTINVASLGSTYTQVDVNNDVISPGWVSGGDITVTGSSTFDVAAGVGYLRATNSRTAPIYRVSWPALNGNAIAPTQVLYVYVSYNAGNPQVMVSTTPPANEEQNITLSNVVRAAIITAYDDRRSAGDFGQQIHRWSESLVGFRVASGETMSATTTRYIALSGGDVFDGNFSEFTTANFDSSNTSTFSAIRRDGSGGLISVVGQTQWDNTQIDSPAGTLTTMTDGYYANKWIFRARNGLVAVIYGRAEYATLEEALNDPVPNPPTTLSNVGYFTTQITYQKNATQPTQITSIKPVIGGSTAASGANLHNNLSGLQGGSPGQYYHLTQAEHAFLTNTSTPSDGAVLFSDALGLQYDATNFNWDAVSKVLNLGGGLTFVNGTGTSVTSTNVFATSGSFTNLSVSNPLTVTGLNWTNATGTNTTSTNFFATNGVLTNLASGNAILSGGSINAMAIGTGSASTGVFTDTTSTNSVATNLTAGTAAVSTLSFANGTSTSWFGFTMASGTTLNAQTAVLANLNSSNVVISGGSINGTAIGSTVASTGVFTNVTSTNATSSNLFATNLEATTATISNLTLGNPLTISGLNWTNATGTNTTSTNLFATNFNATNSTSSWLGFTTASGNTINTLNLLANSATILGGIAVNQSSTIGYLNWTNATGTNATTTNFFATSGSFTNLSVANPISLAGLSWVNATGTNTTSTNLAVTGSLSLPSNSVTDAMVVNGLTIDNTGSVSANAINSGTLGNGSVSLALASFGSITGNLADANVSNVLTLSGSTIDNSPIGNTIASTGIFTNVTSTNSTSTNLFATNGSFANLSVTNPFNLTGLNWTNATGTNTTSTNLFATNLSATNATIANLSLTNPLTVSGLNWTNATGTNTTSTNLFATNFNATNSTSSWLGFTTASGTTLNAQTALLANLTSGNVTITGGSINGTTIGATTPSTGVFTNATATNAFATNLSGTNATIANLSLTNPLTVTGLNWTNATGTNTTSTNLFATRFNATNATSSWLGFTTASGTTLNTLNLTANSATILGGISVNSSSTIGSLNWTNATGTNTTSTNFFATSLTATNGTIANLTLTGVVTAPGLTWTNATGTNTTSTNLFATNFNATNSTSSWLGFTTASGTTLNAQTALLANLTSSNATISGGSINGTAIGATTPSTGVFTNATATNLAVSTGVSLPTNSITDLMVVNGLTVDNTGSVNANAINAGTLGNGSVTLALGSFGSITGNLTDANVSNVLTVSGGTIDNSPIGNSIASTGIFTNVTSTSATSTNLFATNGSFTNLSVTNPLTVTGLNWTNATGTNTTSTNLFATNLTVSSATINGGTAVHSSSTIGILNWTTAAGTSATTTNFFTTNLTSSNAVLTGGSINGAAIGATTPSTGVFTNATATNAFATNGTFTNLSSGNVTVTGGTINNTTIGATTPSTGRFTSTTVSGIAYAENAIVGSQFSGAGLSADCSSVDSKVTWNSTTKQFGCAEDLGGNVKTVSSTSAVSLTPASSLVVLSTVSITPGNTASDIWISYNVSFAQSGTTARTITVAVFRNTACSGAQVGVNMVGNLVNVATSRAVVAGSFVDSPNTTSATSYTVCASTNSTTGGTPTGVERSINAKEVNLGADLAEVYYSLDGALAPGEVVSLDPRGQGRVMRSEGAYNPHALGVVSTRPGLLIGEGNGEGSPVAVALSGRIPVRVTSANGAINPGDYLTSSDLPGVAMKATKAGSVIGQALSTFTDEGEGTVMLFVKNSYYQGKLMAVATSTQSGVDILTQFINQPSVASSDNSLIVTDKLVAGLEVVSTKITAQQVDVLNSFHAASATFDGLVYASSANIGLIINPQLDALTLGLSQASSSLQTVLSGLEFASSTLVTQDGRLASLEALVGGLRDSLASVTSSLVAPTSSESGLSLADTHLDGGLEVDGQVLFHGGLKVDRIDSLNGLLTFASDTYFFGRPYVNADTAGFAIVKRGDRAVTVAFEREYLTQPVINATISFDDTEEATSTYDARVNSYFAENTAFVITRKSVHGFTILLDKPAADDITFNWIALAVKDARIILSSEGRPEIPLELSTPTASEPIPTASDSEAAPASTPPQDSTVLESDSTSSEVPPATEESAEPVVEAASVVTESAPEETAPVPTETTAPASPEAVSQPTESAPAPEAPSAPPAESPAPAAE